MVSRPRHGLSLCAGGGGLDLGVMLTEPGYHTRAFVEWEEWPRAVLIAAQRAGYFAPAPIWDDLRSFDARPFHGAFDIVLAGYPCQPFSAAGKRGGADDPRHLWPEVARVVRECAPEWVFLENVAGHVTLGLETVLRELWRMGYTPAAGLFSAAEVGAPHQRLRIFILAHTDEPASGTERYNPAGNSDFTRKAEALALGIINWSTPKVTDLESPGAAAAEPAIRRLVDGLAHRSRALRLLGNGVHPLAAAHAWRTLAAAHGVRPVDLAPGGWAGGPSADEPF